MSNKKQKKINKSQKYWLLKISIVTLIMTYLLGMFSEAFVRNFENTFFALLSIFFIILVGVLFDIVGVAVAAADDIPFLSMASKKIRGANEALILIKNASRVSSFCNDVIGDICGILSGSAGTILVARLIIMRNTLDETILSILISSLIAALTVGGKAFGKNFAMENSQQIVLSVGYILSVFDIKNFKRQTKTNKKKE